MFLTALRQLIGTIPSGYEILEYMVSALVVMVLIICVFKVVWGILKK